jgi:hypothetical protein
MTHSRTRSLTACAACAAGLLLGASRTPAQVSGLDPYTRTVVTAPSRYWGYTYQPYADPISGPLHAAADAVRAGGDYLRAEGDYLTKKLEAASLREDVRQKKLVTRRQELEHWEWERDFRKNELNRQLERERERQVEYNRNFPSAAEITGAGPLVSLYDELKKRPDLPAEGSTKVEAEWLRQIHVTVSGRGNIGLLKGDKIIWPRLLFRPSFGDDRDRIEMLLERAKKLALAKDRDQEKLDQTLDGLESAVRACQARLDREIHDGVNDPDCNPRHQIEGLKFLRQVTDATFILEKPDAAYYLNPLQGNTVAELVGYMKKNGLTFAPATVGCERAYVALHRALADEVNRIKNQESPSNNR